MSIAVTITSSKGHQAAATAARGNQKSLEYLLRTLVDQDINLQSAINATIGANVSSNLTGDANGSVTVTVGFQPKVVRVTNITDKNIWWEWNQGMSSGSGIEYHTSTNGLVDSVRKLTIASGIVVSATAFKLQSGIDINTKVLFYEAVRGG